jgi:hypothetical protein
MLAHTSTTRPSMTCQEPARPETLANVQDDFACPLLDHVRERRPLARLFSTGRRLGKFQVEVVVGGRGQVGQAHVAVWPFLQDTEIELLCVPGHSGVVVRDADADVVPGEGGERAGRVLRRVCASACPPVKRPRWGEYPDRDGVIALRALIDRSELGHRRRPREAAQIASLCAPSNHGERVPELGQIGGSGVKTVATCSPSSADHATR